MEDKGGSSSFGVTYSYAKISEQICVYRGYLKCFRFSLIVRSIAYRRNHLVDVSIQFLIAPLSGPVRRVLDSIDLLHKVAQMFDQKRLSDDVTVLVASEQVNMLPGGITNLDIGKSATGINPQGHNLKWRGALSRSWNPNLKAACPRLTTVGQERHVLYTTLGVAC
jgi:hypothetical protein